MSGHGHKELRHEGRINEVRNDVSTLRKSLRRVRELICGRKPFRCTSSHCSTICRLSFLWSSEIHASKSSYSSAVILAGQFSTKARPSGNL